MWWDCAKHIKKNQNDASYLMESHSSTTMTPHGLIHALHTEFFFDGIRYAPTWNLTFSRISKFKNCTDQIVCFFAGSFRWVYSLWCLIYCADEEALHKKWHFFVVVFGVDFLGPLIRTQFRFFPSLLLMPIIIMHVKKGDHMEHSIHILDWILTS